MEMGDFSRSQLWQWIWNDARMDDGRPITPELYREFRDQELAALGSSEGRLTEAAEVLDRMADEGPWYALGDGETFEDMIFTTLIGCGTIRCAECGEAASVT